MTAAAGAVGGAPPVVGDIAGGSYEWIKPAIIIALGVLVLYIIVRASAREAASTVAKE